MNRLQVAFIILAVILVVGLAFIVGLIVLQLPSRSKSGEPRQVAVSQVPSRPAGTLRGCLFAGTRLGSLKAGWIIGGRCPEL